MPFPLIPVAIGTLIGVKGPALYKKVKGFLFPESALHLDAHLPDSLARDAINTLANTRTPALLAQAAAWYDSQGYPITAAAISQKLATLVKR